MLMGRKRFRHQGYSMIEVLVSIFIVSLGILALSGLMVRASTLGKTAEFRSVASLLAADIADRMRANPDGSTSYALAPSALATAAPGAASKLCNTAPGCSATEMAAQDLADWQAALFAALPSGTGAITVNANDGSNFTADVWVMWRDPGSEDATREKIAVDTCSPSMAATENASCMYFRVGR